ncbi:TIGR04086 family membrane protein [Pseudogracilibacillus auburnensis]|uniref:Putative membrane protein (TIGR04086 family) n=1 Tax=Pseudogracilibacillus auburnensis TaxID=1494959 RepID=A0A2V3WCU0_9BACI|nr:TIGR04086 family membrane protein [Pseudogracilibacillus auburnensis]MBO1003414.1 TIGR04086 family membrane protein [Pseudogracilibacillus auburnensis]PXW86599.1 putative membrane protein (TIGR04086 family) [Pseudogracilibacillus auburnensis]
MKNNHLMAIVYGWVAILVLVLLSSMLLSVLIRFTNVSEFTLSYITLTIGLLSLFIGGVIAGLKGKEKGWILGSLTGIGFTLLTFFIQYLGYNAMFSLQQLIFHITYILAAMIGSIIGVNLIVSNKKA